MSSPYQRPPYVGYLCRNEMPQENRLWYVFCCITLCALVIFYCRSLPLFSAICDKNRLLLVLLYTLIRGLAYDTERSSTLSQRHLKGAPLFEQLG